MEATMKTMDEVVSSVVEGAAGIRLIISDDGPATGTERYSAEVPLMGAWHGTLRLEVSPALAEAMMGEMLRRPGLPVDERVVMDAMGELANMIAGNLRPMITGARCMGVPVVERRATRSIRGIPVLGRAFAHRLERMEVELFAEQR